MWNFISESDSFYRRSACDERYSTAWQGLDRKERDAICWHAKNRSAVSANSLLKVWNGFLHDRTIDAARADWFESKARALRAIHDVAESDPNARARYTEAWDRQLAAASRAADLIVERFEADLRRIELDESTNWVIK